MRILLAFSLVAGLLAFASQAAEAAPIPAGFPNASNTGLSNPSLLTVHDGDMTITQDGAVVENLEIRGAVFVEADNVVLRNVWVYSGSFWAVDVRSGSVTLDHVEIGNASQPGERGISGGPVTARYVNIHHVEDGLKLGNNSLYEFLYIHDLDSPQSDPHADGAQAETVHDVVIRNSTLDSTGPLGDGNSAVILKSDFGSISNVTIENSYLNGGNYTIYSRNGGSGNPSNVVVRNNVFGPDNTFGLLSVDGSITFTGNKLSDGRLLDSNGNPLSGYFTDDDGNPHEQDINSLAEAGVTTGCAPAKYCPSAFVTRAEVAVFALRALDESPSTATPAFSDVPAGAWYAGAVQRLVEMEILNGCAAGRFCPSALMTRAEMAAVLSRALDLPSGPNPGFVDVPASAWYASFAASLADAGITQGCSTSPLQFCPNTNVTRAQMASFLVRAFNL